MAPADTAPASDGSDARDELRHALKTPLTVIAGRSQLLARTIRRSSSLGPVERTSMLTSLAAIEASVQRMCTVVDDIGSAS